MRFRTPIVAIGLLLMVLASAGLAHPKPAEVPYRWELIFDAGDLRMYTDPIEQQPYWYMTYKVTNRTGKVQVWAPSIALFTDTGHLEQAGREVPNRVTENLLELLQNPLLEDQNSIIGDILHGREHAKEGLVVWPARSMKVNKMSVFTAGISGETARVRNPITREEQILRKTLQRDYLIRGNAAAIGPDAVELLEETWIMR